MDTMNFSVISFLSHSLPNVNFPPKKWISQSHLGMRILQIVFFSRKKNGYDAGKSLSDELILAATNPQYVKKLFIELRVQ